MIKDCRVLHFTFIACVLFKWSYKLRHPQNIWPQPCIWWKQQGSEWWRLRGHSYIFITNIGIIYWGMCVIIVCSLPISASDWLTSLNKCPIDVDINIEDKDKVIHWWHQNGNTIHKLLLLILWSSLIIIVFIQLFWSYLKDNRVI